MKKIILLMLLAILSSGVAMAQNANRHGFFIELGIGGLVGDTPRSSISITDNVVSYKCLAGAAADFGMGGRFRFANHWAYEVKTEAQIPLDNPVNALVGRALPIGFRYISGELWRNYSIYAHLNVGGAITVNNGIVSDGNLKIDDYYRGADIANEDGFTGVVNSSDVTSDLKGYFGQEGYGVAYSAGVGFNITQHLYLEGYFSGQTMFKCFGNNGKGQLNYGMVTFLIGYRF